jgi:hypothetical protein
MKTIIALLFALAGIANAAISTATKPHTIDSAVTPKVSYVDDNDEALLDKIIEIIDTINLHNSSGAVIGSVFSSTGDMRLLIDSDNNGTNQWSITSGGATDTLWRILEGGTWKVFGDGTGTKLTLSDSILATTARISGLTASRLMATNADKTIASVSDLTSWVAGTTNQITSTSDGDGSITLSIPNGFTLPSASPTFTGLTLSGNATVGGTLGVTSNISTTTGYVYTPILALPSFVMGSAGSNYGYASNINATTWALGYTASRTVLGTSALTWTDAGAVTIPGTLGVTGASTLAALSATTASFSSTITTPLTASLPVFTNGSSALTTNAVTGTGNVVMSTSPTLVTPVLGAASATSIALGGGEAFTYGDTSFTITVSTGMTTTPSGTANASRVGRVVTLEIPELLGTSNATTFVLSGVPSGWRTSSADQYVPIAIFTNNSVSETGGYAIVGSTGTIELIRRDTTPWTSSGGKGVYGTITYLAR